MYAINWYSASQSVVFRLPRGRSQYYYYFYNNVKISFSFFTVLIFALMLQKPWWVKLLALLQESNQ